MKKVKLFALDGSKSYGQQVCDLLKIPLCKHEEYYFDDGEVYCASLENVRGCDVFVVQSMYSDEKESVNDKYMKLFVFLGALHDASAKRVIVVMPYFGARQDRKTSSRAPISTKYSSWLFESVWAKRILTLDVHNPTAIQNAYEIPVDLLEAKKLFAQYITQKIVDNKILPSDVVVMSPDIGGLPRATNFKTLISECLHQDVGIACMYKTHVGKEIKGHGIMRPDGGDIAGKHIIVYDDMISSGKTIAECCEIAKSRKAKEILAVCASHGLFVGKANEYLDNSFLRRIVITDTIQPFRLTNERVRNKLTVIPTTNLFAEAIKRIASNESISTLI